MKRAASLVAHYADFLLVTIRLRYGKGMAAVITLEHASDAAVSPHFLHCTCKN